MWSITSIPGEVLDLIFDNLEPCDLKSLRLASRALRDHVGHSYIQHLVLTSDEEHLKHIETFLDSKSKARCIKRLTFDCRKLLPARSLTRVIYQEDPMALILRNYDKIGDRYATLASRFLDFEETKDNVSELLTALMIIIRKLPSLRHVIVAEQTQYGKVLPPPRYLVRELRAIHPLLEPYVGDELTKRMVWAGVVRTRIITRTVILAVWKSALSKCMIELQTLYARYGDGGGPTVSGLCDVVQYLDVKDSKILAKRILRDRPKDKKLWGNQYAEVYNGSPVIMKGREIPVSVVDAEQPKDF